MIRKDNTDSKVFKREFYTKETRKKGIEMTKGCKFLIQFSGNLSEKVSGKQSSLNLNIFLFFYCFIEKFQSSLNFEFSLRFFSTEFLVEFSFCWIFFQLNFLGRTSVVDFHLFLLLFLAEIHSWSEWQKPSPGLSFRAFSSGPRTRTESSTAVRQKEEVTFRCRTVWDYFSLLHCC